MTNKEKQAKLQYLLNSLSMTKEQKDIVVDLVNNSDSGSDSGANIKYIYMNRDDQDGVTRISLQIDDVITDHQVSNNKDIIEIISPEFVNAINGYINTGCIFNFVVFGTKITSIPIVSSKDADINIVIINLQTILGETVSIVIADR